MSKSFGLARGLKIVERKCALLKNSQNSFKKSGFCSIVPPRCAQFTAIKSVNEAKSTALNLIRNFSHSASDKYDEEEDEVYENYFPFEVTGIDHVSSALKLLITEEFEEVSMSNCLWEISKVLSALGQYKNAETGLNNSLDIFDKPKGCEMLLRFTDKLVASPMSPDKWKNVNSCLTCIHILLDISEDGEVMSERKVKYFLDSGIQNTLQAILNNSPVNTNAIILNNTLLLLIRVTYSTVIDENKALLSFKEKENAQGLSTALSFHQTNISVVNSVLTLLSLRIALLSDCVEGTHNANITKQYLNEHQFAETLVEVIKLHMKTNISTFGNLFACVSQFVLNNETGVKQLINVKFYHWLCFVLDFAAIHNEVNVLSHITTFITTSCVSNNEECNHEVKLLLKSLGMEGKLLKLALKFPSDKELLSKLDVAVSMMKIEGVESESGVREIESEQEIGGDETTNNK